MKIDLNCDMGESFGTYKLGNDAEMMRIITSANIACGFHAGGPKVMSYTVSLAAQSGVAVGAHPGYPDLNGFGRRDMALDAEEIEAMLLYQIGALAAFTKASGVELVHVKAHGALYNRAAINPDCAAAIAKAVARFSKSLILVGLAGSEMIRAGEQAGLQTANEGFPDRIYLPDGCLMPRSQAGAVIESPEKVAQNALRLAREGVRIEKGGSIQYLPVDTLCLHGDNITAVSNAKLVAKVLADAGIELHALT